MRFRVRRILSAALALLLVFAQHAALAHAIAYHVGHAPAAEAAHGGGDDGGTQAGRKAKACDFDELFAAVLGGVGTSVPQQAAISAPVARRATTAFFSFQAANLLAAAPRGPPAASL